MTHNYRKIAETYDMYARVTVTVLYSEQDRSFLINTMSDEDTVTFGPVKKTVLQVASDVIKDVLSMRTLNYLE